jgi:hypothetical protein
LLVICSIDARNGRRRPLWGRRPCKIDHLSPHDTSHCHCPPLGGSSALTSDGQKTGLNATRKSAREEIHPSRAPPALRGIRTVSSARSELQR